MIGNIIFIFVRLRHRHRPHRQSYRIVTAVIMTSHDHHHSRRHVTQFLYIFGLLVVRSSYDRHHAACCHGAARKL